jgi:hypothetical protein
MKDFAENLVDNSEQIFKDECQISAFQFKYLTGADADPLTYLVLCASFIAHALKIIKTAALFSGTFLSYSATLIYDPNHINNDLKNSLPYIASTVILSIINMAMSILLPLAPLTSLIYNSSFPNEKITRKNGLNWADESLSRTWSTLFSKVDEQLCESATVFFESNNKL